jgi:hypothetical protein
MKPKLFKRRFYSNVPTSRLPALARAAVAPWCFCWALRFPKRGYLAQESASTTLANNLASLPDLIRFLACSL